LAFQKPLHLKKTNDRCEKIENDNAPRYKPCKFPGYMKKILLILFSFSAIQALACLNEYRTLLNGEVTYSDEPGRPPYAKDLDVSELEGELARLEGLYKIDKSHETLSDYGAILIYLGRLDQAIDLYRRIERQQPNLYATAANIGTAFELSGQLDSAYAYIAKAIRINPDSHKSSEWIHLKILEARKTRLKNSDNTASILGLDFGDSGIPREPTDIDLDALEAQLRFQLRERMTFVKEPDLVVGELLFDLGNICAFTTDVQTALLCYERAKEYGYNSAVLNERIAALTPLAIKASVATAAQENPLLTLFIIGMGLLVLIWMIIKIAKVIRW
jgi:tetratricopeptide (TPR) repeat protein